MRTARQRMSPKYASRYTHLGWKFTAPDDEAFYALIVAGTREEEKARPNHHAGRGCDSTVAKRLLTFRQVRDKTYFELKVDSFKTMQFLEGGVSGRASAVPSFE